MARRRRTCDAQLARIRQTGIKRAGRPVHASREGHRFEPRRDRMEPPPRGAGPSAETDGARREETRPGSGHERALRRGGRTRVAPSRQVRIRAAVRTLPRAPGGHVKRRGASLRTLEVDTVLGHRRGGHRSRRGAGRRVRGRRVRREQGHGPLAVLPRGSRARRGGDGSDRIDRKRGGN